MAAQGLFSLAVCLLMTFAIVNAASKTEKIIKGSDNNAIDNTIGDLSANALANTSYDEFPGNGTDQDHKPVDLTKCDKAFCHRGKCTDVPGVGAVCSCPDDRMYLADDQKTCKKKVCKHPTASKRYTCGTGATCDMLHYDVKLRLMMPQCVCKSYSNAKYKLNPDTKSCERDTRYRTCEWPTDAGCDQACRVVSKTWGKGSSPQCTCGQGYALHSNRKTCIVTDPCAIGGKNGGCQYKCGFDRNTKVVRCSCPVDHTLNKDGKTCDLKNCANGNSGCQQGCVQTSNKDYFCTCSKGYHLNNDRKTCYDYDECSGFHGCDQNCVPDGKGYYFCTCDKGYVLDPNGFSCRVAEKCVNHGCSQHCNPTDGSCYCDDTHQLAADQKKCVDKDECALGTDNCEEVCINTEGGFSCACNDDRATLSNDLRTCLLSTCEEIPDIKYGKTSCQYGHGDGVLKTGDYCTFTCNRGTRLVGSTTVRCTKTGHDVTPPHCADINECEDPTRCLENERCVNTIGSFTCVCLQGFQKKNGKCTDTYGPQVTVCPSDVSLQLPDDADSITYTWQKPKVFDPTDAKVSCINCPSSETKTMGIGAYSIRYDYQDDAGNSATCSFKIKVDDVTDPVFQNCPNGTVFNKPPGVYDISEFAQVTATDNSGKVIVTHDVPKEFKNPGNRTVNYNAKDESGNHATCTFYVNIVVNECSALTPPENGYHGCSDWHVGTFCIPKCNDGFAFYTKPAAEKYHCGPDGQWAPAGALPKCYPTVQPLRADIKYVSKYRGKCPLGDDNAQAQVLKMAQAAFDSSKSAFCFIGDSCKLPEGPAIVCDGDTFSVTMQTDEDYSKIPEHDNMLVEFKKKIRVVKEKNPALMSLFIPPLTILQPLVDGNGLPVSPVFDLGCPAGSQKIGNQCVTCPPGAGC